MEVTFWHYILPPVVGSVIGFTADTIAIKMLFRPYRPLFFLGRQIPLTPGLFPRGQERFARKVATTLTDKLLTPEEVHRIARRLLGREQLAQGIRWVLLYGLGQLNDPRQRERLAQGLGGLLQRILEDSLPQWTAELGRSSFTDQALGQVFDRMVLPFTLSRAQGETIAGWINESVLTPELLRQALVNGLSATTIDELDRQARDRSQGGYWLLANVIGVKGPLGRLKDFCRDQPEQARALFKDVLSNIRLRDRLTDILVSASFQKLPPATLDATKTQLVGALEQALTATIPDFSQRISESINWTEQAEALLNRAVTSETILEWIDPVAEEGARILDQYLSEELEQLVTKLLPSLGLEEAVITKINQTSPAELEDAIQSVARSELQALPYVGAVVGFFAGFLEMVLLVYILPNL
ncbi:DUF445 domain-containing protein [Candidatus Cyanaurora vandensis]|uniref:DUF445 domain-containing protein n=1 Tax=Candidatus Cyanaurora vandensis TaxID=2714958 RepID=UPI00257AB95C|nr:DUF445 family protein [Candidatus Cyanaurora vandensis]